MTVLVVTGGIGSGKSLVCRMLHERWNLPVYDADSRVKALYREKPALLADIETALGCVLRDGNGQFVPQMLAERIFSDSAAMEKVEALVFPAVLDDFRAFSSEMEGTVVFESATILEKPQFDGFGDKVMFVDAPMDMRLERACMRDGSSRERILARMESQKFVNSLCGKPAGGRIDAVVVNDGTVQELQERVDDAFAAVSGENVHDNILNN